MKLATALSAIAVTVALIVALPLARTAQGLALLAYGLSLGALALVLLIERLRRALPLSRFRWSHRPPAPERDEPVNQFERIRRIIAAAVWTETQVYESLRPIVSEIVATKLARRYGVDLIHSPAQAQAIVGDGYAWDLVRPDRRPPLDPRARGWSREKINKLLDELEAL